MDLNAKHGVIQIGCPECGTVIMVKKEKAQEAKCPLCGYER